MLKNILNLRKQSRKPSVKKLCQKLISTLLIISESSVNNLKATMITKFLKGILSIKLQWLTITKLSQGLLYLSLEMFTSHIER